MPDSRPMPGQPSRGYVLRYATLRALEADHATYFSHGGMLVPAGPDLTPPLNASVELRIEAPDGSSFSLPGRSGSFAPGRGFLVSFEEGAARGQAALGAFVQSAPFRAALAEEPEVTLLPPEVRPFDPREVFAEEEHTDPGPGQPSAFDEDTPVDEALAPRGAAPQADPKEPEGSDRGRGAEDPGAASATSAAGAPAVSQDLVRGPDPGERYPVYAVRALTVTAFAELVPALRHSGRFPVPFAEREAGLGQVALLRLTLPGHNVFELWSQVDEVEEETVWLRVGTHDEAFRKVCLYPESIAARSRLAAEASAPPEPLQVIRLSESAPEEDVERLPIRRRLARMGMEEKINLALSGGREERMALAMDSNRAVHHYLLKNAKISLDEVAFMARLPSLNPDVLDKIAENPQYTQNPSVTKALVYNPKTPVATAIRLLDRLPRSEVMNLAKRSGMNLRLVMAAKKKVERSK